MVDPILTASIIVPLLVLLYIFTLGFRIVIPTERGLVERLGKHERFVEPGFHWIIPVVHRMFKVNITEKMVTVAQQAIITKDKLNAQVSAQIYFKVKPEEGTVKASQYNVNKVDEQIVALAQTTLRNIIGTNTDGGQQ
ncbi:MAG: hypothetical protein HYU39_07535 [Thaumarchaeota archaeon]|nr:hypothetical protein [Nitrososphaerota archaeon]